MIKGKEFETLIASPPDYEELVAEIYYEGLFVGLVSQERGKGLFDIETPGRNLIEDEILRKVDAAGFIKAIEAACQRLQGEKC